MSAHPYIQYADAPDQLLESALHYRDAVTGAQFIACDGNPFGGEIVETDGITQIEYSSRHSLELRHALVDRLTRKSISFDVVA